MKKNPIYALFPSIEFDRFSPISRVYVSIEKLKCVLGITCTHHSQLFFNPLLLIHRAYGNWMRWKKFISMMTFSEIIFWYDENINQFRFELVNLFFTLQYSAYGHFPSLSLRLNLHKGRDVSWIFWSFSKGS